MLFHLEPDNFSKDVVPPAPPLCRRDVVVHMGLISDLTKSDREFNEMEKIFMNTFSVDGDYDRIIEDLLV